MFISAKQLEMALLIASQQGAQAAADALNYTPCNIVGQEN